MDAFTETIQGRKRGSMTREEREKHLDWLYRLKSEIFVFMPKDWMIPFADALDVAIKALEQEPYVVNTKDLSDDEIKKFEEVMKNVRVQVIQQEPCDDCISRQAVLDLIADYDLSMGQVVRGIHALPSVTPQQETVPFDFELYQAGLMDMPKGMIEVLNKIRAEIDAHREKLKIMADDDWYAGKIRGYDCAIEIIDKYKAESEG